MVVQNYIKRLPYIVRPIPEPLPSVESAVNFSRRHLLASLGLVLPTMAVMATEAEATTNLKKHRPAKHGATAQAPHKHTRHAAAKPHRPVSRPSTEG
jgi:hypothetical protein